MSIERVTHDAAAEALDSLDDFARMDSGVDASGPRGVLERYIAQQRAILAESQAGEAVACSVTGYLARSRAVEVVADDVLPYWLTRKVGLRAYLTTTPPAPSAADAGYDDGSGRVRDWRGESSKAGVEDGFKSAEIPPAPLLTPTDPKAGAWPDDAALRKLANLHGTRSYAMDGKTGVEHQGWSFRPEQLASFAAALTAAAPQAPVGGEPNIGVGVDVTAEGAHVTVAHRIGAVDHIIYSQFHAAPPALTQPVDRGALWSLVASARHTGKDVDPERIAAILTLTQPAPSSGEGAK